MVLSMRRVGPTRAATATSVSPSTRRTGSRSPGSHERQVLGLDAEAGHRGAARGGRSRRVALAAGVGALGGVERAAQGQRAVAVVAAQVHVAARQRQAVGLADGRADLDPHGQVEVRDQAADDGDLLGVLLAEERDVGSDHVEQLGDDGGDARRSGRAAVLALEVLGSPPTRTVVAKPGG